MKRENSKRICAVLALVMILVASAFLASCEIDSIADAKIINAPDVLYVEEFDPEMNHIRKAVDDSNIKIQVTYTDGTSEEVQLKFDMLADSYQKELNSEGRHYIAYTYKGKQVAGEVLVKLVPTYTVRFYDNSDNVISEQTVKKGEAAVAPTEDERFVEGYVFVEWDKAFDKVTEDLDVYGVYEKEVVYYTVNFYNNSNKLIGTQQVKEGEAAVEPTEAERAVAGYVFVKWDKAFEKVTADLDVYGVYEKEIVYYTVKFYNNNNELIGEQKVKEGEAAVEPTEAERAVAGYVFVEWDKAFDKVTADLDVYGVYEKEIVYYTVNFYNNSNELIGTQKVKEGDAAIAPTEDERAVEGYIFIAWDKAFDNVTSDLDVYGVYEKLLVVTFYNSKNNLIATKYVQKGGDVSSPTEKEKYLPGYVFLNWDAELTNIQQDTAIYGIYISDMTTDTDGDGIIDYIEIEILNLDYLKVDTDDNGITDDKEDFDGDGLSNLNEIKAGLKPDNPDTDGDGLSDGDEIDIYWTLPADPDTDGDGLSDGDEVNVYKTDPVLVDTDGDGLSDGDEVNQYQTKPTESDTDGDGLSDGDELNAYKTNPALVDTDGDGLSDGDEVNVYKTNPTLVDTDGDGLSDGDEVNKYQTKPTEADTDGDGANDGWEINNNFDPLVYNASFEVQTTVAMPDNTQITVEVPELAGEYVGTTIVEASTDESIKEVHGSLGEAIQYNVSASATITISSDELQTAEDPVLMYFNTTTKQVEPIPVAVSGNEATASITKYGSYVLVDRKVFEEKGQWRDVYTSGNYSSIEIVFVIDDSGSMYSNDRYNQRLSVAKDLINKLPDSAKIGIVRFDSSVTALTSSLTTSKATATGYLTKTYFDSSGLTLLYGGAMKGLGLYSSKQSSDDVLRVMILISDGYPEGSDSYTMSSVINTANSKGVQIYTVGLGNTESYFNNTLRPLATGTDATFSYSSNASALASIYEKIGEKIDMTLDTDKDGLADFFESGVDANGNPTLPTINGMNFVGLDKNDSDTDDDGYLDGEEIEIFQYYSDKNPNQVMIWGIVHSDPTDKQSVPANK